jgi:hypothetical protein
MARSYEDWKAAGRPGGSFEAWQGGGAAQQALPAAPMTPPQAGGVPSSADPLAFQAWYNQQQGGNRSEDMARFIVNPDTGGLSGDTLSRWDPYLVREGPNAGKYRSMRGAEGFFDKPTECPPGMGPSGGDERNPCTTVGYSTPNPWESGATSAAPQQAAMPMAAPNPLQDMLAQVQQVQPQASPTASLGAVPTVGQGNLQQMQGALQGLLSQNQAPAAGVGVPKQLGTGWQVGTDGLSQMMQKQQRISQPQRGPVMGQSAGRWF